MPAGAEGSVDFISQAKGQAPPVRAKISEGRYQAEKVPVGKVLAVFHLSRATGKMLKTSPTDEHPTPERIDLVPEGSRQGVSIEVKGDNPQQNFDLR